jgi:peptidoglycan/LPS O-acetylase OafA/YrhL
MNWTVWPIWKKLAVTSGICAVGIAISLFTLPPQTPLFLWATVSGITLLGFNCLALTWRPKNKKPNLHLSQVVVIAFGFLIVLIEVWFHYLRRR